jgi:hypothetical protein
LNARVLHTSSRMLIRSITLFLSQDRIQRQVKFALYQAALIVGVINSACQLDEWLIEGA